MLPVPPMLLRVLRLLRLLRLLRMLKSFKALRDLEAGEELTFNYGGNTADWDGTEASSTIAQRHIVSSRTRSGGA